MSVLVLCLRVDLLERDWWIDLPELTSIRLGDYALDFVDDDDNSGELIMRSGDKEKRWWIDLPKLISITTEGNNIGAFYYLSSITLESSFYSCESPLDIPSLTDIFLSLHAFKEKKHVSITGSPIPWNAPNQ